MSDRGRSLLAGLGLVTLAAGLLFVVRPELGAAIRADYGAVTLLGVLGLVQCLRVLRARRAATVRGAEPDDVETVVSVPTPGAEFDRTVAQLHAVPRRISIRRRDEVRETLRRAAVRAVAAREHCSPERARELVAAGTWTDDPHAAAFLGGPEAPTPPVSERLRIAASGHTVPQFRVRRTADAIADAAGLSERPEPDRPVPDDGDGPRAGPPTDADSTADGDAAVPDGGSRPAGRQGARAGQDHEPVAHGEAAGGDPAR